VDSPFLPSGCGCCDRRPGVHARSRQRFLRFAVEFVGGGVDVAAGLFFFSFSFFLDEERRRRRSWGLGVRGRGLFFGLVYILRLGSDLAAAGAETGFPTPVSSRRGLGTKKADWNRSGFGGLVFAQHRTHKQKRGL
jgi:hypothetical protein